MYPRHTSSLGFRVAKVIAEVLSREKDYPDEIGLIIVARMTSGRCDAALNCKVNNDDLIDSCRNGSGRDICL